MQAKNDRKCMQNLSPCIMNVLKTPIFKNLRQNNSTLKLSKKNFKQSLHKRI